MLDHNGVEPVHAEQDNIQTNDKQEGRIMAGKKKNEAKQVKEAVQMQEYPQETVQEQQEVKETKEERQHRLANDAKNMNKNIIMHRTRNGNAVQQNPELDNILVKMPVIVNVDKNDQLHFSHMSGLNALTALQRNYDTKETSPLWLTASAIKSLGLEVNFPQKGSNEKTNADGRSYTSGINIIVDANKYKGKSSDDKSTDNDKKFDPKTIKLYNLGTLYSKNPEVEHTIRFDLNNSYETTVGKELVHNYYAAVAKEMLRVLATKFTKEQAEADYKLRGEVFNDEHMSKADKCALLNQKAINLGSLIDQSFASAKITVMTRRANTQTHNDANISQTQTATRQNGAAR